MSDRTPSLATPYRTHTDGELRASDAGSEARLAGWVHRRRDHGQLIFLDLRDRHGLTQIVIDQTDAPAAHEQASRIRPEYVVTVRGEVARRLPGTENPKLPTGEIELRATEVEILSDAKTPPFYINEPDAPVDEILRLKYRYLDIRREPMLRRLLLRTDARASHPRRPRSARLRRDRDADAHQEHARGRPRLRRAVAPPARIDLRPAAEPAAAQAAAHGRGHRPLLPDRPLLPRRGPARRPPAGVLAARPRDELRRRGDRHGLRRVDGDRGVRGGRARATDPAGPVPGLHLRRGHRALRLRQAGPAVRDGAHRPRAGPRPTRRGPRPPGSGSSTTRSPPAGGSRRSSRPGWPA